MIELQQPVANPAVPQRSRVNFDIDPELGVMYLDSVQHRYFDVSNAYAAFDHDVLLKPFPRDTHFGLAIMNSPTSAVKFDNRNWTEVKSGQTYFTFNPGVEELHHFRANHPMRSVFFDIKPEYLTTLLLEQEPRKGTSLYAVRENVATSQFAAASADIPTTTFNSIVEGILNCPLQGTLGNLMLEGALQQLLAIQFAMMGNEMPARKSIANRDRSIITAVKDHLDTTFNEDHSLVSLSKKFGINQNKLKTQFRELFGVPVIGYLYDRKMEHARMLLLDKGMFVNEVSSLVGYRNPNHFATAFKRKFGINPSKLKG